MSVNDVDNFPPGEEPTIGIGRPVASDWMNHTQAIFDRFLPDGSFFQPRNIPGVAYVSAHEVAIQPGIDQIAAPETIMAMTGAFIGNLAARHSVGLVSIGHPDVFKIKSIHFDSNDRGYVFNMKIYDKRTPEYGSVPKLHAEKSLLRDELGLKTEFRAYGNPKITTSHWLRLGIVNVGQAGLDARKIKSRILHGLGDEIPLLPVAALDSTTPEK